MKTAKRHWPTGSDLRRRFKGHEYQWEFVVANTIRHLVPRHRSILFHGTRYGKTILRENTLKPDTIVGTLSFTRQLHVAVRFAWLPQDDPEPVGAILMLDRDKLVQTYRLDVRNDFAPDYRIFSREAEETSYIDICNVSKYLLGVIWLDENGVVRPNQRLGTRINQSNRQGSHASQATLPAAISQQTFTPSFKRPLGVASEILNDGKTTCPTL